MKKKVAVCLILLAMIVGILPLSVAAEAAPTITVYNWGQYISDGTDGYLDVIEEFTAATGIKVNYITYDSNESLYTKLKTGGTTYDVIIPSDYMIAKLIEEDMLEELNFDNIPNYQYIDDEFRNMEYDPQNKYSVPYTWGTVGIIYNKKYVDDASSWASLWNEKYSGKILTFDNCRDSFAIAQSRLGYDLNTNDPAELRACADLLTQQRPLLQGYVMDQIFDKMEREEAWIAPYYAGDYLTMVQENENLGFSFPEEGFNIFVDAMCIPKGCENKEGAEAFINFLCDPQICGQNLEYLGYSTPETEAKQYMDPEVVNSEIAYPSADVLARATSFSNLSTEATQLMNSLWLDVKTSGSSVTKYILYAAIVVAVVAVVIAILTINKRKKKQRRGRSRSSES